MDAARNLVFVDDRKAVIIGGSDLIVALTSNGLLICPKSEEPWLKKWLSTGKQGVDSPNLKRSAQHILMITDYEREWILTGLEL
ncbi:hypothetical protein [Paenibacillus popilliae]|uniref:Hydrolase n=1 Tax=Paenibacillus popilliae ATCC 14706 TaxID=1212764 RepID=M9LC83_PAEPP|nr:hypothetical protein [Paenibacillus popilliae]GAC43642.1 hydrolase [Paenibacillus popilliae ATCC 14706]